MDWLPRMRGSAVYDQNVSLVGIPPRLSHLLILPINTAEEDLQEKSLVCLLYIKV